MTIPYRGSTGHGTYFITASTFEKAALLQTDRMAQLLLDVLFHYREQRRYLLHEFVIMPNHFHLLITPIAPVTLEKAIQFIKGGFSYRAKKELGFHGEIWQTSFHDRRVRDQTEYCEFQRYIHLNPVRKRLVATPGRYEFSSAKLTLDETPQGLKPAMYRVA